MGDLVARLRGLAAERPDDHAYTFFDPAKGEERITWGELDARARAVAAMLRARTKPGDRALLLHPPGLDYVAAFLGCLYAGVVAVPAYPPLARRWIARVQAIAADADPVLALTDAATAQAMARHPELGALPVLATNAAEEAPWADPAITPDTIAFLQYTSGSTAAPKGVVVPHGALVRNLAMIHAAFGHGPESVALVWLPPYHDMGLVGGILQPLWGGFPGILMPPAAFLKRPLAWLAAIHRFGATTSGGPNFAFDLCARKLRPEALAGVDLSGWKVAFNGAEPVRADTMARFAEAFAPWGFEAAAFTPCYGLAEATLIVTSKVQGRPPVVRGGRVGSGVVLGGQDLRILDPETHEEASAGEVGEIWLAGPSVAAGYWHRDDEAFRARTAAGDGPFLRTGDLGFLHDGELFVTGRLKDLLIVDGANHYPQDLEATAEASHPALRAGGAAAFAIEAADGEGVALVAEVAPHAPADEVIARIRQAVSAEHGVGLAAVALLAPGGLPRTSSGKVQRHRARLDLAAGTLPVVVAWGAG